ncbi:MAG: hypothetical protein O9322_13000 [Beijerinckiaceae bacterium]|nr:hypothetical protein [Beijerinckiaceae bacterium]MCZ8300260.1 hypothetical protein [Beijerinckiaceae bacterium]
MTLFTRSFFVGLSGLTLLVLALSAPGFAQSTRIIQNQSSATMERKVTPGQRIGTTNTLPQGVRAPGRRAGDAPAAAPNTSSNIGRDTAIPSLGGGLKIGGQTTGGSGKPASGPDKKRPGGVANAGSGKTNPITPDEFGRQRQLDTLVNGRSRRIREQADTRNQNAPGNKSGQALIDGWQSRKNGLNPRTRPSRQSQQSSEGEAKPKPGLQKDGTFVHASADQLKNMSNQQRGRYFTEREHYRPRPEEPREKEWTLQRIVNTIVPKQLPQSNCDNGCWRSNNRDTVAMPGRIRPAPDAVDTTNPTRPASLVNVGTAPFDPFAEKEKRNRKITLPNDKDQRLEDLRELGMRPLSASFRVNPAVVNPVRDDGTASTTPSRSPAAAPVGSNRPGGGGGSPGGCTPDNPTC